MKNSLRLWSIATVPILATLWTMGTYAKQKTPSSYWQTKGYGYIVEVTNEEMTFFDITEHSCVRNPWAASDYEGTKASQWITVKKDGSALLDWHALHLVDLIRLDSLPERCQSAHEIDLDPVKNFDVFWSTYSDHFPYGEKQNWHWKQRYPIWRSMITRDTSSQELANVFSNIINQIRDGHADLVDANDNGIGRIEARLLAYEYRLRQAWKKDDDYEYFWPYERDSFRAWKRIIAENYATQQKVTSHYDNFHYAMLDNNISYLRIDEMIDFTDEGTYDSWLRAVDTTMQALIPEINKSSGLVIDLRGNGGGTDSVSLQLLSYLFKEPTRIGAKATVEKGSLGQPKDIWVEASDHPVYEGPAVVLTSQATASAAEIMLIGLLARKDTLIIGEPSNGSFSDILPKQLPNGWQLGLSHQVYLDAKGIDYEEVGIPVESYIPFLLIEDLEDKKDKAIEKAISLLRISNL